MDVKYPHINVELVGQDGNAFSILSRVRAALKNEGVAKEDIDSFMVEATSGDYNHLLQTVMEWVSVDSSEDDSDWGDEDEDGGFKWVDDDEEEEF